MNSKQFSIKLFAYLTSSINDVIDSSYKDQIRWVNEVKKYYPSKYDPADLILYPSTPEGEAMYLKNTKHITGNVEEINYGFLEAYPLTGYEYIPSINWGIQGQLIFDINKEDLSKLYFFFYEFISWHKNEITVDQVLTHLLNQFAKINPEYFLNLK